jgi:hypothetical protein
MYVGGAALLILGLVFTGRIWWALIHQHANLRDVLARSSEVLILAIGFLLVLVIPLAQFRGIARLARWRDERRSEMKGKTCVDFPRTKGPYPG